MKNVFKLCKHQGCAVCTNIHERKVFESILQTIHPEVYVCEHAAYAIRNFLGSEYIMYSLEFLKNNSKGFYIRDMYTDKNILLNTENLKIICTKQGECDVKPFVTVYSATKKGS